MNKSINGSFRGLPGLYLLGKYGSQKNFTLCIQRIKDTFNASQHFDDSKVIYVCIYILKISKLFYGTQVELEFKIRI